jgi:hypothetical protein
MDMSRAKTIKAVRERTEENEKLGIGIPSLGKRKYKQNIMNEFTMGNLA